MIYWHSGNGPSFNHRIRAPLHAKRTRRTGRRFALIRRYALPTLLASPWLPPPERLTAHPRLHRLCLASSPLFHHCVCSHPCNQLFFCRRARVRDADACCSPRQPRPLRWNARVYFFDERPREVERTGRLGDLDGTLAGDLLLDGGRPGRFTVRLPSAGSTRWAVRSKITPAVAAPSQEARM